MHRFLRPLVVAAAAGALASIPARTASACGACFHVPSSPTVVSGHRMVMSISQTQTVLWDQIQYQGDPSEFAWVLPVKPGARVEASTAAFFEVLEAMTRRNVTAPPVQCDFGGGGPDFGCKVTVVDDGGEFDNGIPEPSPVEVVHQGTVGPYETVTLSTMVPGALNAWLTEHGYAVDASSQPIIDAYVAEGFDFIALRLQPGKGISAMTPVRVVTEGANPSLPLRMVGIGTGANVPIVLYTIGEGVWSVQNFPEAHINPSLVAFDFETNTSNYAELRKSTLSQNDGRSWITSFAQENAVFVGSSSFSDPNFGAPTFVLADQYFQSAFQNSETPSRCTIPAHLGSGLVKNPCPAGEPWNSPQCGMVGNGEVDSRDLGCPGADDLSTALEGLHLQDVWITRLEAELPHAALDTDLVLAAAQTQTEVNPMIQAGIAIHPDAACGNSGTPVLPGVSKRPPQPPMSIFFASFFAAMGLALGARRALRRPVLAR